MGAQLTLAVRALMNYWTPVSAASVSGAGRQLVMDGLLAGDYRMTVTARGFARLTTEVSLRESSTRDLDLQKSVEVVGQVVGTDGRAAAGAKVQAWVQADGTPGSRTWDQAVADGDGRFCLVHLVPGELTLEARHGNLAGRLGPQRLQAAAARTSS